MRSFKVFLIVGLFLLGVESGLACSCAPSQSAPEELKRATVVFAGKVVEIKRQKQDRKQKHPAHLFTEVEVRFAVERVWKGVDEETVTVFTSSHSASCGYRFQSDHTYLVYAYADSDGKLQTGICSRTKRLKDADEDVKELGPGTTAIFYFTRPEFALE